MICLTLWKKNNILEINDERILSLCQMAKRNDISFLIGLPLRIQNRVYISALYINCEGNIEEIISKIIYMVWRVSSLRQGR